MPNLEVILEVQEYIIAVLLFVVAYYWSKLKSEGVESLFKNPLIINLTLLLALPFILITIPKLPELASLLIESLGITVLGLILFIVAFKDFKHADDKRYGELHQLIEERPRNPIALEFARKIVEPQIQQINKERRKLEDFERSVHKNLSSKEDEVEAKVKEQNKRMDNVIETEKKLKEDINKLEKEKSALKSEKRGFLKEKEQLEDLKDEIEVMKSKLERSKEKEKKKRKDLRKLLDDIKDEKEDIELKTKQIDETFLLKEKLDKMKEKFSKKEDDIILKEKELKKRIVMVADKEEDLEDEKNEFAAMRKKFETEMAKFDDVVEGYNKRRSNFMEKENEIAEKEEQLKRWEKDLVKRENEIKDERALIIRKQRELSGK